MISRKIAMLGMWGVGKTSLVQRFVASIYDDSYHATVGVKVDKKVVSVAGTELNLMLWDIAGAEEAFNIPLHYVRGAAGYLLVLDGTRPDTLDGALEIVRNVESGIGRVPFVPVVNKSDLAWSLTGAAVDAAFAPWGRTHIAASALNGSNVDSAFETLAASLMP